MTTARVFLDDYSNTVLNVIKAKYSLKDKSEALNRFIRAYGNAEVEPEVKESYIKKILELDEEHVKKYGNRKMGKGELEKLFGKVK